MIARYAKRKLGGRFFRADTVYASPAIYERLEEAGYFTLSGYPPIPCYALQIGSHVP